MRPPSNTAQRQGRYVLGDLLGRGGMAEVFSGYVLGSHGFQKPVAIKRLLPELANDHVFVERLIGEAKLLVGMQHGNIVSVLDLARDGDDVFLVMEYVDGPSLRQLLKARGSRGLSLAVSTYIVQAAAAGLEFAHARPGGAVIHADISPSNLLLTTSGEVRVADFGIARREGGGAGVVEGKWAYMAPEQARGESLTPRSDVFALGVVLYELITGQHPLGQRITPDERDSGPIRIAPPRVVNPHVPPGLDAICMKALAEHARDRYGRMQQLIDSLVDERFANGWREGANDLAQAIREIAPGAVGNGPRTQVTDRPVTLHTRSLISAPIPRISSPVIEDSIETLDRGMQTPPPEGMQTPLMIPPSGARTLMIETAAPLPPPPTGRVDGTPPEFRFSAALLPAPELASVHGGATASQVIDVAPRSNKWTVAVLGIATLVGIGAALLIQHASSSDEPDDRAPLEIEIPKPPPVIVASPPQAPEPAPVEAPTAPPPTVEQAPAPAPPVPQPERRPKKSVDKKPAVARGESTLRVNTLGADSAWAFATIGSQRKEVPGAKFKLAPGRYTVRLSNPDLHLARTCVVVLEANAVQTLKVDLEEGICEAN